LTTAPRVYFYCSNEPGNLQEDVIALAEGMRELGVPFYANCDYWLQSTRPGDYLFRQFADVTPDDCDIVVVTYTWVQWVRMGDFKLRRRPLPEGLFKSGRRYVTVAMDNNDGYRTPSWEPEFRAFDIILRSKFNSRAAAPANMRPWAYGLTNRIVEATRGALPYSERADKILVNFNVSHPFSYDARDLAARRFEPRIGAVLAVDNTRDDLSREPSDSYAALMWRQTGGRFSRGYYERLKRSKAMACFCGDIIPPAPQRPESYLMGGNRARLRRAVYAGLGLLDHRPPRAVGADSFRFWEALAAGCTAINLDLDHYGVALPVMPINGVHYLGVDLARVGSFIAMLKEDRSILGHIAERGRVWAQTHYSPEAMATRLLAMTGYELRRAGGSDSSLPVVASAAASPTSH
jgi:hypothetical protein